VLLVLGILCGVLLLYPRHLDVSPPALHPDEAAAIRQAQSIAQSGRDLDGRRLPLFFHLHDNVWIQPLPVYFTALVLTAIGPSDATARVPSVIVAAIDAVLIYCVAARLFRRGSFAVLLIVTGLGLFILPVNHWRRLDFGELPYSEGLRFVIPAVTVITLGVQIIFSSFFLSVLGLGRK
jgi:4-amino-4-deoxy-L-arabinose transferase-like glycosyltransferase